MGMKRDFAATLALVLFTALGVGVMDMASARAQDAPVSFKIAPHHVALSVPDAEASAAWYKKMLGFEVVTRMTEDAANKMKVVHIKRGDAYIELFEVEGAKPLPEYRRDPSVDFRVHGLKHFAFQVEDAMAAFKELRAKGAEIAMEPLDLPGIVFGFVRDNAGNCFELIQYKNVGAAGK
ncbi:MAG: VOC family protein [Acidobacteriota bacterium]|jgi:methylmalonyl-CoA/ethylmalonyl-CoA epimerase|nr:VOC family protein [Acidobacteriota bacterium]